VAGGVAVALPPRLLAFYAWMARKRLANEPVMKAAKELDDNVPREHATAFLAEYRKLSGRDPENTEATLRHGLDYGYFSTNRRRLHDALRRVLDVGAVPYEVKRLGQHRGHYEYRVD